MSSTIILPNQFNTSDISFSDVKTNNYGGKVVYMNKSGGKLILQTPKMFVPYGLGENEITDQKTNEVIGHKYHVNLSFREMQNDENVKLADKLKTFHQVIKDIDEHIITTATKNSLPWLKMKKVNRETIEALYSPMLILSKDKETQEPDGKYPDTIKGKIPFWEGKFKTTVYDQQREEIDLKKSIVKGTIGKSLLECTGIWFAGGKFGVGWKVLQMKVEVPKSIEGYSFVESDDDDDDGEDGITLNNNNEVSDSDSDSDEEITITNNNDLDNGIESDDE